MKQYIAVLVFYICKKNKRSDILDYKEDKKDKKKDKRNKESYVFICQGSSRCL